MEQQQAQPIKNIEQNSVLITPVVKQNNTLVIILSVLLLISVLISGLFAYQTQNLVKELNELKTKYIYSPTQLDESEVDPTADWKTYLSDKYPLSFKYPNNIVVEEEWVGIGDNSKAIYQIKLGQVMNLEIRNLVQRRGGNYKEILLDSGVILYEDLDSSEKYVFFDKDNLSYDVMLLSAALEKEFDQILSTFKFTN